MALDTLRRFLLANIKLIEGPGSPEATPNLDVKSRGPNHTTILVAGHPS